MQVKEGRLFIGRFDLDGDLLGSLEEFCSRESVKLGVFSLVGAVTSIRLGYYDQSAKKYLECVKLEKKLEIASCMGNISLLDSRVFVHTHITLADHEGRCYGGHLMPGSKIFAAEYCIKEFTGGELIRKPDAATGLNLW